MASETAYKCHLLEPLGLALGDLDAGAEPILSMSLRPSFLSESLRNSSRTMLSRNSTAVLLSEGERIMRMQSSTPSPKFPYLVPKECQSDSKRTMPGPTRGTRGRRLPGIRGGGSS